MLLYARTVTGRYILDPPPCKTVHLIFNITHAREKPQKERHVPQYPFPLIILQCNKLRYFKTVLYISILAGSDCVVFQACRVMFRNSEYAFLNVRSERSSLQWRAEYDGDKVRTETREPKV